MNLLRNVLDSVPTAAIVVDKNLKVRYTNRAFREYFNSRKARGSLKEVISCGEREQVCGTGVKCAYCPMRGIFLDAGKNGGKAFRKLFVRGEKEDFALRVKVQPLGKFWLGIVDNAYETEIAREMYSAQDIQQRLLPPAKSGNGTPYSFLYLPCREIGGDLPDVYEVNGETMGLIADVSGHGISAGMLSAFVKAGWDRSETSPATAIRGLNAKFQELNLDERSYVTAAAVRIDRANREIRYSVAGHNAPLLLKSKLGIDEIVMNSPPVSTWIPDFGYEDRAIGYEAGDILVMLTDGIIESRNADGEQFSLERVEGVLQKSENAERFIERLKAVLKAFCHTFDDDLTAVAFDL
ncbi:MAG: SpoIIE family protein phosphatase [Clostridia bacterium]|nr:SpoIIE family protein phosphatase [Clostridia bacterium]